ncbi:UNVERIFIED_CONTAM: hypothetical protein Sradi_0745000, partial [Sesamum radiatum]
YETDNHEIGIEDEDINLVENDIRVHFERRDGYESSDMGEDDLLGSDDDLESVLGSDYEESSDKEHNPVFIAEETYDHVCALGMLFSIKKYFKNVVHSHAVKTHRNIKITKNDNIRCYAKCVADDCGWRIHALKKGDECSFVIREYNSKHICGPTYHVKNINSTWLLKKYEEHFWSDPKRNVKGFRNDVVRDIRCQVSKTQAYRAKKKVMKKIEGSAKEQYSKLWEYVEELRRSNPGSTISIGTIDDVACGKKIEKLYICFKVLKDGFLAGCRQLIGVDDCHLKGPQGEIMLTAVGVDPSNNLYPIAYAVVSSEKRETWKWFLNLLMEDLNIERDYEYTFISYKQKGFIQVIEIVFPNSNHRFCIRHMHSNFKNAGFRGQALKMTLWKAAKATTLQEFRSKMQELAEIYQNVANWLSDKPPTQWSRSNFTPYPKCNMLLNNYCETFNSNILEAREKSILTMLEWLREYLMIRLQKSRDKAKNKWGDKKICPRIKKIIEQNMTKASDCIPLKSDDYHYETMCFDGSRENHNMRTCPSKRAAEVEVKRKKTQPQQVTRELVAGDGGLIVKAGAGGTVAGIGGSVVETIAGDGGLIVEAGARGSVAGIGGSVVETRAGGSVVEIGAGRSVARFGGSVIEAELELVAEAELEPTTTTTKSGVRHNCSTQSANEEIDM